MPPLWRGWESGNTDTSWNKCIFAVSPARGGWHSLNLLWPIAFLLCESSCKMVLKSHRGRDRQVAET